MSVDDDELRNFLQARAAPAAGIEGADPGAIARTVSQAQARRGVRPGGPLLPVAAAMAIVVAVIGVGQLVRPASPTSTADPSGPSATSANASVAAPTASPSPSATVAPSSDGPQVFSAAELAVVLSHRPRLDPDQFGPAPVLGDGEIFLFDGTSTLQESVTVFRCASIPGHTCPPNSVARAGAIVGAPIRVIEDSTRDPSPWERGDVTGTFAVRDTGQGVAGDPVVELVGRVIPDLDALAWQPGHLGSMSPIPGQLYVVSGWLVAGPLHPCPSPASVRGCPSDEWLTDEPFQPAQADGSSVGTDSGLSLPSGSYQHFARDPEWDGVRNAPRLGTYLVRLSPDITRFFGSSTAWEVVGRIDPTPEAASGLPPAPAIVCGRLDAATCSWVIVLARSAGPGDYRDAARIVADNGCPPDAFCALGFRAIVVLSPARSAAGADPPAYSVYDLYTGLPTVAPDRSPLPAHIKALLDAP